MNYLLSKVYVHFMLSRKLFIFNNFIYDLNCPLSLNYLWSFGFILATFFCFQILSGFIISIHFFTSNEISFFRVLNFTRDTNISSFRYFHVVGSRFIFFLLYLHILRGIFYKSIKFFLVWALGIFLYILTILSSFLGYVLPWGQMSFWAASVITNLVTVIPFFGTYLISLLWGSFSVSDRTLNRFYTFHFILPLISLVFILTHLHFLHLTLSNNSIFLKNLEFLHFFPFLLIKDFFSFLLSHLFFLSFFFFSFFLYW